MKYKSTRGKTPLLSFQEAVMTGLAPDGGLLLPENLPDFSADLAKMSKMNYQDLAYTIMSKFIDDIEEVELKKLIKKSYSTFSDDKITPLVQCGDFSVLELFHGPTLAFKDVALQFLGNLFGWILEKDNSTMNILGATSGDTGSAAIYGVRGNSNIQIYIMHPKGRVSLLQELQMTTVLDENVHNIAVDGSFDDCQAILKDIFNDLEFKKKYHLGAVNSVNWARILAQIVYYFQSYFQAEEHCKNHVVFSVPTGNFGDIFAGYLAYKMGLPIKKLLLATNENDILSRFFNTGIYKKGKVQQTLSPAMDIQVSSNFERYLFYLCDEDGERVDALMKQFSDTGEINLSKEFENIDSVFSAESATKEETLHTIKYVYEHEKYVLDPHTAAGVTVAAKYADDAKSSVICLSTAHPAKFPDAVKEAIGENFVKHDSLEVLKDKESRCVNVSADSSEIKKLIIEKKKI